ncbi:hypothetical protein GCM10010218_13180 [Streptomyces mashuensis]|uniref:Uncharacterized protein n=1 Tax=Streptomyces mashuensis TaxID=33904 RepID=A0A919AYY6_9ACTN|nr:DUF6415 family natural product biosynthesis protein [Streptomyces mashuensis]GHF33445.1 hypothetical protein GCM10010218_13180 [Streptomyces mashuensis]
MASLTAAVPGKAEIRAHVDMVLAWNLNGPALPALDSALCMIEQLTDYGRIVANDLRAQCLKVPADSDARHNAQATLGEASRRLHLPPPYRTPQAAGRRAQNIARLVNALLRAVGEVSREQARTRRHQQAITPSEGRDA